MSESTDASARAAYAAKLAGAERQIAFGRLIVLASGTVLYPFAAPSEGTHHWLAVTLLALGWVYGAIACARPTATKTSFSRSSATSCGRRSTR